MEQNAEKQIKEFKLVEILNIIRPKIEEGITGKIILNFNEGKLSNVNFEYTKRIK